LKSIPLLLVPAVVFTATTYEQLVESPFGTVVVIAVGELIVTALVETVCDELEHAPPVIGWNCTEAPV
jgi:putative effector of murein hydrolase LrgA (UPF0299 family)